MQRTKHFQSRNVAVKTGKIIKCLAMSRWAVLRTEPSRLGCTDGLIFYKVPALVVANQHGPYDGVWSQVWGQLQNPVWGQVWGQLRPSGAQARPYHGQPIGIRSLKVASAAPTNATD